MHETTLTLINPLGLHARAAAKLVDACKPFSSEIKLTHNGNTVDAKSIMSLLMLAAPVGSDIHIEVTGEDESEACAAVCEVINAGFYELDET